LADQRVLLGEIYDFHAVFMFSVSLFGAEISAKLTKKRVGEILKLLKI
jgi:hypothetical protein